MIATLAAAVALLPFPVATLAGDVAVRDGVSWQALEVSGRGIVENLLSQDDLVRYRDMVRTIGQEYEKADRRGQAQLVLRYLEMARNQATTIDIVDAWFLSPDGHIVRSRLFRYPDMSHARALIDVTTGEYIAVIETRRSKDFAALMEEVLRDARTKGPEQIQAYRDKLEAAQQDVQVAVEVNGQREYVPKDIGAEGGLVSLVMLTKSWSPEAGERLRTVWGILEAHADERLEFERASDSTSFRSAPPAFNATTVLGLPFRDRTLRFKLASRTMASLIAPDSSLTRTFLGEKGWVAPDLTRPFANRVRNLAAK